MEKASWGERGIVIKVDFFTTDLDKKHAWTRGTIRIVRNKWHGIVPGRNLHFNSLMEIPTIIERVLIEQRIHLHPDSKMAKYIDFSHE